MFGYLVPEKDELRIKDWEQYRAMYCGICHAIKSGYGQVPRLLLKNDLILFVSIWINLSDKEPELTEKRCVLHPLKKHKLYANHAAIRNAADICMLLAEIKLDDDYVDEGKLRHKAARAFMQPARKKLVRNRQALFTEAADLYLEMLERESALCTSLDEMADLSGQMIRAILLSGYEGSDEMILTPLGWLGYHIGRWLYLTDALQDMDSDLEKKRYNVINLNGSAKKEEVVCLALEACRYSIVCIQNACDLLDFKFAEPIIDNILFRSMPDRTEMIAEKLGHPASKTDIEVPYETGTGEE